MKALLLKTMILLFFTLLPGFLQRHQQLLIPDMVRAFEMSHRTFFVSVQPAGTAIEGLLCFNYEAPVG